MKCTLKDSLISLSIVRCTAKQTTIKESKELKRSARKISGGLSIYCKKNSLFVIITSKDDFL